MALFGQCLCYVTNSVRANNLANKSAALVFPAKNFSVVLQIESQSKHGPMLPVNANILEGQVPVTIQIATI
uniref:Uncharacterized protein n=1 Tax=Aegilops tauschii subsp. strangulata TaxID=200361 RepID=A0A453MT53_AEGTS